jgi:hypothetical protein
VKARKTQAELDAMSAQARDTYFDERHAALVAEAAKERRERPKREAEQRDAESLARFTESFVKLGGDPAAANQAWRSERNRHAAASASAREAGLLAEDRRRRMGVL